MLCSSYSVGSFGIYSKSSWVPKPFLLARIPRAHLFFPKRKISVCALLQRPFKRRERNINPLAQLQEQQWSGEENQLHETPPKKTTRKKEKIYAPREGGRAAAVGWKNDLSSSSSSALVFIRSSSSPLPPYMRLARRGWNGDGFTKEWEAE